MMIRLAGGRRVSLALSVLPALVFGLGGPGAAAATDTHDAPETITLPGARVFPESITSTSDGTVYIGSLGAGGVLRAAPGADRATPFIRAGALGSHSVFGVLADEHSGTLWACSNDLSERGVVVGGAAADAPGAPAVGNGAPAAAAGGTSNSALLAFDLQSGRGRFGVPLPGEHPLCNDLVIGVDGSAYVTNMLAGQILRLKHGARSFEVFSADPQFLVEGNGSLDGIAFGGDGDLYVNTYTTGKLYRVRVRNGVAGKVTPIVTSRALSNPDALRLIAGNSFVMIEGAGRLDRVTVTGDHATIDTIRDGYAGPTGVTLQEGTAWVSEGQLSFIFDPAKKGKSPRLPFKAYSVDVVQ